MNRGATLTVPFESMLLLQRSLTVAFSAYNAFYFATYPLRSGRHHLGAVVLAFINLAIAGESVAFGLLPRMLAQTAWDLTTPGQLVAASLSLAVSLTMTALILRQRAKRR